VVKEICKAIGIEQRELFYDSPPDIRGQRPAPRPVKIDLTALAFRYDLAALDRRLRADTVLKAVNNIPINELPDHELDRLVDAVGHAYTNLDRAELFEGVADDLREKAFARKEGTVNYAAQR
jgi:hypothetical protein